MSKSASTYTSPQEAFGQLLRELRIRHNLKQEDVAVRSGVDRTYISLLERGLRAPSLPVILGIAQAFDISPGELVNEVARRMA